MHLYKTQIPHSAERIVNRDGAPKTSSIRFAIALFALFAANVYGQSSHVTLPEGSELTNAERQVIAISPQGTRIAYMSQGTIYLRGMGAADKPVRIPGLLEGFRKANPVFSPDGQSVAYWSMDGSVLERISVRGGTPVTITKATVPFGMSWGTDDQIVYGEGSKGIFRVSAKGGSPGRPESFAIAGSRNRMAQTRADTGLPGRPSTGTAPSWPNSSGFPGRMAICQKSSVMPRWRRLSMIRS